MRTKKVPAILSYDEAAEFMRDLAGVPWQERIMALPRKQQIERRSKIAKLWLEGNLRDWQIAERLGVSQSLVSKDKKWLMVQWIAITLEDVTEVLAHQLAVLDRMDVELWQEWHRSKKAKARVTRKREPEAKAGEFSLEKQLEGTLGNPRYMELILRNMEMRVKLLGLDSEKNQEAALRIFQGMLEAAESSRERYDARQEELEPRTIDQVLGDDYS